MSVAVCAWRCSPRAATCRVKGDGERAQEARLFRSEVPGRVARVRPSRRPRQQRPQADQVVRRGGEGHDPIDQFTAGVTQLPQGTRDADILRPVAPGAQRPLRVLGAAWLGKTRLIDNIGVEHPLLPGL